MFQYDGGIRLIIDNIKHLDRARPEDNRLEIINRATSEVGSAVLTAVLATVVSFLPVFAMEGAEGCSGGGGIGPGCLVYQVLEHVAGGNSLAEF